MGKFVQQAISFSPRCVDCYLFIAHINGVISFAFFFSDSDDESSLYSDDENIEGSDSEMSDRFLVYFITSSQITFSALIYTPDTSCWCSYLTNDIVKFKYLSNLILSMMIKSF